jgi:hypothetical protein
MSLPFAKLAVGDVQGDRYVCALGTGVAWTTRSLGGKQWSDWAFTPYPPHVFPIDLLDEQRIENLRCMIGSDL